MQDRYSGTRQKRVVTLGLIFVLLSAVGCQFAPEKAKWPIDFFSKKKEPVVPTRMMVIWSDTVLHQPQQPGVRGFGGRIYFYLGEEPKPVVVDGGLAVYAFDADQVGPDSTKPERKFVFTADQFSEHMSHTSMGPSYSIWLPWDQVGGVSRKFSLITRFEGRNGGVVISDPAVKLLPGVNEALSNRTRNADRGSSVAQASANAGGPSAESKTQVASYLQENSAAKNAAGANSLSNKSKPRRKTETIDLPPSFYRHLSAQSSEPSTPVLSQPAIETPNDSVDDLPTQNLESDDNSVSVDQAALRNTTWARYPFRTIDGQQSSDTNQNRQQPLPAGWLQQLPKTPRYSYPNSSQPRSSSPK